MYVRSLGDGSEADFDNSTLSFFEFSLLLLVISGSVGNFLLRSKIKHYKDVISNKSSSVTGNASVYLKDF